MVLLRVRICPCCGDTIPNCHNPTEWAYQLKKDGKKQIYCSYECFKKCGGKLEREVKYGRGKMSYPQEGDTLTKLVGKR